MATLCTIGEDITTATMTGTTEGAIITSVETTAIGLAAAAAVNVTTTEITTDERSVAIVVIVCVSPQEAAATERPSANTLKTVGTGNKADATACTDSSTAHLNMIKLWEKL